MEGEQNTVQQIKRVTIKDDDSDWQIDSIEQLKGTTLKQMIQQQNQLHEDHHQSKPIQKKVVFPEKPLTSLKSTVDEIGKIVSYVGGLIVIVSTNNKIVVDLDNWLCDESKNIIGFVMDVLGKVEAPFYVVKSEDQDIQDKYPIGSTVYYIQGTKVLKQQDIASMRSKRACDAEVGDNDFESQDDKEDEDNRSEGEKKPRKMKRRGDFSDDEQVRQRQMQRSRTRDNKNRRYEMNRSNRASNEINQSYLQGIYSQYYNQMMFFQYGQQQGGNNFMPPHGNQQFHPNQQFSHPNQHIHYPNNPYNSQKPGDHTRKH